MEEEGRFLQAKEEYESEALLKNLSDKAEALGMIQGKILVLEKLYKKFRKGYGETLKRSVEEHEDEMSIRFKGRLDLELRGKEIVVCDTNVWVHKLFNGIDEFSEGNPEIAKQFDMLSGEGNRLLMTETVRGELERLVPGLIKDEELGDGSKKTVRTRLERYVEKYAPKGLVKGSLLNPEHVDRVRKFYQNHPFKLKRITEEKIERNPGRRNELLLKRVGSASLTRERGSEGVLGNPMPEENDIRILAECLKLNGLSISGVSKISILSDDSDFKEFSKEIGEEFNIGVHKPTS
ncbi:hypothetical protein AKJ36_03230 [candidate division MSBL1 archaeon SCGC-AAA259I07]|uniref:PIN domain-containing protein n=1 Tax=candidate division MSBL1 archaeon SCGC-AAA259I07 TaxID=1698266 RepID=A0A133UJ49_9EURY|nr:hypothetical protein AKJ36_03230 [candidate division MSBL1 archaeon SCGC-AAA259I07]